MKHIEVVSTKNGSIHSKITIAKDRVTVKIADNDPNREFLTVLAGRCASIDVDQTARGKLSRIDLERGVVPLYSSEGKRVLGWLHVNEEPVHFEKKRAI